MLCNLIDSGSIEKQIHLAFWADGEDWLGVAEHARLMPAVGVPLSSASIKASCKRGLSYFDAFVCANGTIVVDNAADLVTVFAPKPNNEGRITRVMIGRLTDEKVHSWLDIDDEFATNDSCTLEKTAASYFPHILFLAVSPSPKGIKFIIETGNGKRATLTGKQLGAFMKIWYRWDRRYSAEHHDEAEDDSRSGDTFVIDATGDDKGIWDTKSMLDEKKAP